MPTYEVSTQTGYSHTHRVTASSPDEAVSLVQQGKGGPIRESRRSEYSDVKRLDDPATPNEEG